MEFSSTPPIYTFTANLLAETTFYVDDWDEGHTSRAKDESFQVGGKGINVTKMARRLGADSTAICFPGGTFGDASQDWLNASGIPHKAFTTDCITRSGTIIRSPNKKELSILGVDSHVSYKSLQSAIEFLSNIQSPSIVAICGVIQNWKSKNWDPFRDWLKSRSSQIKLVVDTYGPGLKWIARQSPELVKINRDELELIFDDDVRKVPTNELLANLPSIYNSPLWIVTDGEKPIWAKSEDDSPIQIHPPKVECLSPTGCGDVFLATLLHHLYYRPEKDLNRALKKAADYASRNAASPGIADFALDQ